MTAPIPRDLPDLPAIPRTHALLLSSVPASAVVTPVRRPLAAVLRLLLAGTAAAGVTLAFLLSSPLRVLSHFAIQSNILLALVTLLSARRAWTARRRRAGQEQAEHGGQRAADGGHHRRGWD
ncbi:hypothetical protein PV723_23900, partial [Streptomyces sp. AK04-3B]|nr:hypothetical protein [Streptomyces sp. AK04-3B]